MKRLLTLIILAPVLPLASFGLVVIDFSNVTNVQNNTAGFTGGSTVAAGTEILIFEDIASGLDLRIRTLDAYRAANYDNNGSFGDFGQINLLGGQVVEFEFSLVDANTTNLAAVDQVAFSFLDIDGGTVGNDPFESITVSQASQLVLNTTTDLTLSGAVSPITLTGTTTGGVSNNPTTTVLNAEQSEIAATVIFQNTNQFRFTFAAGTTSPNGTTPTTGRNVLFAGDVEFDDPANPIAVPEPSFGSLLMGLLALGYIARRRQ